MLAVAAGLFHDTPTYCKLVMLRKQLSTVLTYQSKSIVAGCVASDILPTPTTMSYIWPEPLALF